LVDAAGLGRSISWWLRLTAVPGVGEMLHSRSIVTVNGLAKRLFEMSERIERWVLTTLHRARNDHVAHAAIVKVAREGAGLRGLKARVYELPRLGRIQAPMLVVWGGRDRVFLVDHAREVARRFSKITVEVFSGGGHWPHMEAPRGSTPWWSASWVLESTRSAQTRHGLISWRRHLSY
jgi:pimeloyl-ACP methyl ester carboxylesterase